MPDSVVSSSSPDQDGSMPDPIVSSSAADQLGSMPVAIVSSSAPDFVGSMPDSVVSSSSPDQDGSMPESVVSSSAPEFVGSMPDSVVSSSSPDQDGSMPDPIVSSNPLYEVGSTPDSMVSSSAPDFVGSMPDSLVSSSAQDQVGSIPDSLVSSSTLDLTTNSVTSSELDHEGTVGVDERSTPLKLEQKEEDEDDEGMYANVPKSISNAVMRSERMKAKFFSTPSLTVDGAKYGAKPARCAVIDVRTEAACRVKLSVALPVPDGELDGTARRRQRPKSLSSTPEATRAAWRVWSS
jgi:hypothetical protein